jgi:hypothetical protein
VGAAILLALLVTAVASTACTVGVTGTFRAEIEKRSPDYARRLFSSVGDIVWQQAWPLRVRPLFLEPVPQGLEPTIRLLRWIYGVQLGIVTAGAAVLAGSVLWHE